MEATLKARAPRAKKAKTPAVVDRTQFIGGSDAAAVLGVSSWHTPVDLWRLKTGLAQPAAISAAKARRFLLGHKLEPVIVELAMMRLQELGHEVELVACNRRYNDPEFDFLSCEIDAELIVDGEHINVDAKSVDTFAPKEWGEEESQDVPLHYAAQFMHGLGITGRQRCLVAAMIGMQVRLYWTLRDDETVAAMRSKCVAFWQDHVLTRQPPDPKKFADIKDLYPTDNGRTVEATPTVAERLRRLVKVNADITALEAEKAALQLDVGGYMADFMRVTVGGKEAATFKTQPDERIDVEALRRDHPDWAALYTRRGTKRVLRVTKRKF